MPIDELFPLKVFKDYISNVDNVKMMSACDTIKEIDEQGRLICLDKFPLGYTSYYTIDNINALCDDEKEPYTEFSTLIEEIYDRARSFANDLLQDYEMKYYNSWKETRGISIKSTWINITEQYHFHQVHNHSNSFISGCYYFNDVSSLTIYGLNQYKQETMTYPSREGLLLMWPGWSYHQADQLLEKKTKYGMSFNITPVGMFDEHYIIDHDNNEKI